MPTPREKLDENDDETAQGSYYYDDAHGYKDFDPEDEEDEDLDEGADLGGGGFDIDLD